MNRLTRLELFLLTALALSWGVRLTWIAPAQPLEKGRTAWEEQETRTRQEVQRAVEQDRGLLQQRLRQNPSLLLRFQLLVAALLLVGLGSLYQWSRVLIPALSGAPRAGPAGQPAPASWGGRQVLRLVLGLLLVMQCSLLAQVALHRWFHPHWLDTRVAALADTLLVDLFAAGGVVWFMTRLRAPAPAGPAAPLLPAILEAFRRYLMAIPLFMALMLGIAFVLDKLGMQPPPQPVFTLYLSERRGSVVSALLVLAVLMGPVAEEFFFRGFLYRWLRTRVGIDRGLLLSSFLFAMLHMDPVAFLPLLGLGILFGFCYERTGSLAAPISIHIFHNGLMLFAASVIKGLVISS